MRKRTWIFCVVVLAICAFLLLNTAGPKRAVAPEHSAKLTNEETESEAIRGERNQPPTQSASTAIVPTVRIASNAARGVATPVGSSSTEIAQILAGWQTPIEFYGKVVDENSNAVSGVKVNFHWVETPSEDGNRTTNTETDTQGLFSLHGQRGPSLSVTISKEGYYASHRGEQGFKYGPFGNPDFSPDPRNPVIFTLKSRGTPEPLVALKRNYRISRDGTPISIDLATGTTSGGENGNFVVRCWTEDKGKPSGQKYDWHCVAAVPGGGIVPTDEEFPFQAPENGYLSSAEIAMPANRPDWKDDVDLRFYYRLADGRYGRMTFSMIAGGQHFFMIDSLLNPSGSRNLEPAK